MKKENHRELIREYKRTPRDMGVVGLRSLRDGSLAILPCKDVNGLINKFDFAKKTNSIVALPMEFRKIVETEGFDGVVIEVVELIENKPEYTNDERLEELELLYEIIQGRLQERVEEVLP